MAWTTPTVRNAGDAILASDQNIWVNDLMMGHPVFTTETARDAAIPIGSRSIGQMVYLTAPTSSIVTASGATTYIPAMVQTVWNGSAWVCMTEVGAFTSTGGTYNNATYGPTLGGSPGTNPSVTTVTGATALVTITANIAVSTTMTAGIDVAISGATTRNAGVTAGQAMNVPKSSDAGLQITYNHSFIVDGLTSGVNVFTLNYTSNNVATITNRRLTVKGIS